MFYNVSRATEAIDNDAVSNTTDATAAGVNATATTATGVNATAATAGGVNDTVVLEKEDAAFTEAPTTTTVVSTEPEKVEDEDGGWGRMEWVAFMLVVGLILAAFSKWAR
jgi:hypothetical protein